MNKKKEIKIETPFSKKKHNGMIPTYQRVNLRQQNTLERPILNQQALTRAPSWQSLLEQQRKDVVQKALALLEVLNQENSFLTAADIHAARKQIVNAIIALENTYDAFLQEQQKAGNQEASDLIIIRQMEDVEFKAKLKSLQDTSNVIPQKTIRDVSTQQLLQTQTIVQTKAVEATEKADVLANAAVKANVEAQVATQIATKKETELQDVIQATQTIPKSEAVPKIVQAELKAEHAKETETIAIKEAEKADAAAAKAQAEAIVAQNDAAKAFAEAEAAAAAKQEVEKALKEKETAEAAAKAQLEAEAAKAQLEAEAAKAKAEAEAEVLKAKVEAESEATKKRQQSLIEFCDANYALESSSKKAQCRSLLEPCLTPEECKTKADTLGLLPTQAPITSTDFCERAYLVDELVTDCKTNNCTSKSDTIPCVNILAKYQQFREWTDPEYCPKTFPSELQDACQNAQKECKTSIKACETAMATLPKPPALQQRIYPVTIPELNKRPLCPSAYEFDVSTQTCNLGPVSDMMKYFFEQLLGVRARANVEEEEDWDEDPKQKQSPIYKQLNTKYDQVKKWFAQVESTTAASESGVVTPESVIAVRANTYLRLSKLIRDITQYITVEGSAKPIGLGQNVQLYQKMLVDALDAKASEASKEFHRVCGIDCGSQETTCQSGREDEIATVSARTICTSGSATTPPNPFASEEETFSKSYVQTNISLKLKEAIEASKAVNAAQRLPSIEFATDTELQSLHTKLQTAIVAIKVLLEQLTSSASPEQQKMIRYFEDQSTEYEKQRAAIAKLMLLPHPFVSTTGPCLEYETFSQTNGCSLEIPENWDSYKLFPFVLWQVISSKYHAALNSETEYKVISGEIETYKKLSSILKKQFVEKFNQKYKESGVQLPNIQDHSSILLAEIVGRYLALDQTLDELPVSEQASLDPSRLMAKKLKSFTFQKLKRWQDEMLNACANEKQLEQCITRCSQYQTSDSQSLKCKQPFNSTYGATELQERQILTVFAKRPREALYVLVSTSLYQDFLALSQRAIDDCEAAEAQDHPKTVDTSLSYIKRFLIAIHSLDALAIEVKKHVELPSIAAYIEERKKRYTEHINTYQQVGMGECKDDLACLKILLSKCPECPLIQEQVQKIEALTNPALKAEAAKAEKAKQVTLQETQEASYASLGKQLAALRIVAQYEEPEEEAEEFD